MIGATPQLSTAVWVGNVDGSALYNAYGGVMYGANTPADLWKYTMDNALVNEDWETFTSPTAVGGVAGAPAWSGNVAPAAPAQEVTPETTEEQPAEEAPPAIPELPAPPPGGGGGIGDLLPFPAPGDGGGQEPGGGGGEQPAPAPAN